MKRKILIAITTTAGLVLTALCAVLLFLNFADLGGRYRGTVQRLLTDATGREVQIAGDLQVDFGFNPTLEARDITLANSEWSEDASMVSIDRLAVSINLASLVFKPIRVHEIEIKGATVLLEALEDGRANWQFDTGRDRPTQPSGPVRLAVGQARLTQSRLHVRTPTFDRPLDLNLDQLDIESDPSDMLTVRLDGDLNDAALMLGGRLGTLAELLTLGRVSHDLDGRLGNVEIAFNGSIGDLATLRDTDTTLTVDGPSMSEMTDLLGLPDLGAGPFHIHATTSPKGEISSVSLDGALGEVKLSASGTIDALLAPEILDLQFRTVGPDIAAIAALGGIRNAANEPFEAAGHLRWEGFPLSINEFRAAVGGNTVNLEGTIGKPPRLLGTDFWFDAEGPDITTFALLGSLDLPQEAFRVAGRLVRLEDGIGIEDVEATLGPTNAKVSGMVGDPPEYAGTNLQIDAKGPDLSTLSGLVGTSLPSLPFTVAGKLTPEENAIVLDGVRASLGPNNARIEGTVVTDGQFAGTDLYLVAEGPDLAWLEAPTGFTDLPKKPFRIEGGLIVEETGYNLRGVNARVGEVTARVDGRVGPLPRFGGTAVTVVAEGPDISIPASLAGFPGLPAKPFRIEGDVKKGLEWLELEGVEAQIGEGWINLAGRIATTADGMGTQFQAEGAGPDASVFGPLFELTTLPPDPYSFSGGIRFESEGWVLDKAEADLGWARAEVDGTVVPSSDFAGTDIAFTIAAPLLSDVGSVANSTGLVDLPGLPKEPVTATGSTAITAEGYELRDIHFTLGRATADINGHIGHPPQYRGTDLSVVADGPDASLFTAITGVTVPVAPFRVSGRVKRADEGIRFHSLWVQLGEYRITANGLLGEPPKLISTDFDFEASGPSLALISDLTGIRKLPDLPFGVAGSFDGDPSRFKTDQLTATLGSSDIAGSFRLDISGRPEFTGSLRSNRLDLAEMFPVSDVSDTPSDVPKESVSPSDFVVSDKPFDLGFLDFADGEFSVSVDQLILRAQALKDLRVDGELRNGRLEVDQLAAAGRYDGVLDGTLLLEPAGTGYRLATDFTLEGSRIDLSTTQDDISEWPSFDFTVNLDSTGASPHELAAAADGRIKVIVGEGAVNRSLLDILSADVLVKILEILNPFTSENPASRLNCAVLVVDFTDGVATLDPVTVQTDTLTILADGRVDFSTEKMSVDWITKPRKGFGVSASLLTNPYIKVGGTLSKPEIGIKPIEAAASTGLAVATGGLSILGKGLLDRLSAEQKVCDQAIKRAEKKLAKKEKAGGSRQ